MANLALTNVCNLDCPYCFAGSNVGHVEGPRQDLSESKFEAALDLLERSGIAEARLLGGEPTLHPRFAHFVERALTRGFRVAVFSNAIMPESALRSLEEAPAERVSLLVNARAEQDHQPAQWEKVRETYRRLGNRVALGYNIDSRAPRMDFLLDHIVRFGLSPLVRLGLAHPRLEGGNRSLRPRDYPSVGGRILEFAEAARAVGVALEFDCGFVPCMFSQTGREWLQMPDLGRRCNPILDLLPNGEFISCYPLATLHREKLTQIVDAAELRRRFTAQFDDLRQATLYPECVQCEFRARGECTGGCLSASLLRSRSTTFTVSERRQAPEQKPAKIIPWAIPYIDQPAEFWQDLARSFDGHIREVYFPPPLEVLGTGRPEQPSRFREEFLRHAPLARSLLLNAITLPAPVEQVAPAVIEAVRRYRDEYGIESATVANLSLAERIRDAMPEFPLTASILMDIFQPNQALMLKGVCDTLVPASRMVRDLNALKVLRAAFPGRIRLLVNEACVSGCPYRVEHFHEMASGFEDPRSLCDDLLAREPWLRLTGSWILPQHLPYYEDICDEMKLAGRVTLHDPVKYRRVLAAYIRRQPLAPHEIGGGPASPLEPIDISEEFVYRTSRCGQTCHSCSFCRDYYDSWRSSRAPYPQLVQIRLPAAAGRAMA